MRTESPPLPLADAKRPEGAAGPGSRWVRALRDPRRRRLAIAALVALVLAAALAALRAAAPVLIERTVVATVRKQCPGCTVEIGAIDLSVLGGRLVARDVRFAQPVTKRNRLEFRATRVELDAQFWTLLARVRRLERVRFDDAHLRVVSDDRRPRSPPDPDADPPLLSLPPMRIGRVEVRGGRISYVSRQPGRDGAIGVRDIDGDVTAFGTRPGLAPRFAEFRARGTLERSGDLALRARVDLLSRRGDARIVLRLRDQAIDRFDAILHPTKGIRARGRVEWARATMEVEDGRLTGRLAGSYQGLEVEVSPTARRSPARAAVMNVAEGLVLNNDQTAREARVPSVPIRGVRGRTQPMLDFLWDGLSDAVLRLIRHESTPLERMTR